MIQFFAFGRLIRGQCRLEQKTGEQSSETGLLWVGLFFNSILV
jgi:hypothetical protein